MPEADKTVQIEINAIRFLAADAIEKAKSGHPGMPMGAAATAHTLWTKHLRHDPGNPGWFNRDRFVLSAGHASMLLYALLHLTGYDLSLDDVKSFRQWGSKTPGHPERHPEMGVEVTTGPLGQGIASAVGLALAERHLAARFNREGFPVVDHFTYVMASDGDLMEGVSYEACSLAGHLGLGKLIVLYDDNRISLAGSTALSFTEDVAMRFVACGWHVQHVKDGNDPEVIDLALARAREETQRPSLIALRTVIGFGAPQKQGSSEAHGAPLGKEELAGAKRLLGWPEEPFHLPEEAKKLSRRAVKQGARWSSAWEELLTAYAGTYPGLAAELKRAIEGRLPARWEEDLTTYPEGAKDIATRKASEGVMAELAERIPELLGGSADLNPSTFTWLKGKGDFQRPGEPPEGLQGAVGGPWGYEGRNIHFGVREHAMAAIATGLAIHGGLIPYTATFLTFCDYMKPSIRLAALMGLRVIYVFTHDSIGLGEDGPTHQPVEHVMSLRTIPGVTVIRPADANETVEAWQQALLNDRGPTALILTRQNLPILKGEGIAPAQCLIRGGYTLWQSGDTPELILISTGSEVSLALAAAQKMAAGGTKIRVVSMPSWELFDAQPEDYRREVLPPHIRGRLAIEAGIKLGWARYVGLDGGIMGLETFGASAPGPVLFEKFGFTVDQVVRAARRLLG
ncbi:MAG: transketolase [Smithellaceae bacterium]|nr:transketolase [Smithellaceae bacterium]